MIKLGVNIDHVATLRQARGGAVPNPTEAALEAVKGGADSITVHLREDRRHIQDSDLWKLKRILRKPLNLEMALHPEIVNLALQLQPEKVCFVPERRRELTTEGGLDAWEKRNRLKRIVPRMAKKGIEVSLFIDPEIKQTRAAKEVGAGAVEFHTGPYANAEKKEKRRELKRLRLAALEAHRLGLKVHAGHGLDYENIGPIKQLPHLEEVNIGHSIVSRAVFIGMRKAVREMRVILRPRSEGMTVGYA